MPLPQTSFAQEEPPIKVPETFEEAQKIGERALGASKKLLPGIIEKVWKEEVMPMWQKMRNWFKKNIWDPYIAPALEKEIEKRKPIIEEEFQKEKKEMEESVKEEVPRIGKSLWDKFKELIK